MIDKEKWLCVEFCVTFSQKCVFTVCSAAICRDARDLGEAVTHAATVSVCFLHQSYKPVPHDTVHAKITVAPSPLLRTKHGHYTRKESILSWSCMPSPRAYSFRLPCRSGCPLLSCNQANNTVYLFTHPSIVRFEIRIVL